MSFKKDSPFSAVKYAYSSSSPPSENRSDCQTTICYIRRRCCFGQPIGIYLFFCSFFSGSLCTYTQHRFERDLSLYYFRLTKKLFFHFFVCARPSGQEMFRHGWWKALWKPFTILLYDSAVIPRDKHRVIASCALYNIRNTK